MNFLLKRKLKSLGKKIDKVQKDVNEMVAVNHLDNGMRRCYQIGSIDTILIRQNDLIIEMPRHIYREQRREKEQELIKLREKYQKLSDVID